MTRGELIDDITFLKMSFLMMKIGLSICFQKLGRRGLAVVFVLDNIKWFVSVDLIGKKNKAILEVSICHQFTQLRIINIAYFNYSGKISSFHYNFNRYINELEN